MKWIFALVVLAGCHPHLGKDFGWATRQAFSAQYRKMDGPGPAGLDGREAEGAMSRQRAFGFPEDSGGGQAGGGGLVPFALGAQK